VVKVDTEEAAGPEDGEPNGQNSAPLTDRYGLDQVETFVICHLRKEESVAKRLTQMVSCAG
jgi:hypothetical protein